MTRSNWIQRALLSHAAHHMPPGDSYARAVLASDLVAQVTILADALEQSGEAPWTKDAKEGPREVRGMHTSEQRRVIEKKALAGKARKS